MTVIHLPVAPPIVPDLSHVERLDNWALLLGGGCPTLVGALEGLPACVEVRSISVDRTYVRLRAGGYLRLGAPAS